MFWNRLTIFDLAAGRAALALALLTIAFPGKGSPAGEVPRFADRGLSVPADLGECLDCDLDDATLEGGYWFVSGAPRVGFLEPLPAEAVKNADWICICVFAPPLVTPDLSGLDVSFDLVVYDDSGPDSTPGNLLSRLSIEASDVQVGIPGTTVSIEFDPSTIGDSADAATTLFVGAEWNASTAEAEFGMCVDADAPASAGFFFSEGSTGGWEPLAGLLPDYGRFFVRASEAVHVLQVPTLRKTALMTLVSMVGILGWGLLRSASADR